MPVEPMTNLLVRDLLIEHIDGRPVTLRWPRATDTLGHQNAMAARRRLVNSLITRGYLKTRVRPDGVGVETVITDKGRDALAKALASWADALTRASEPGTPLDSFHPSLWGEIRPSVK